MAVPLKCRSNVSDRPIVNSFVGWQTAGFPSAPHKRSRRRQRNRRRIALLGDAIENRDTPQARRRVCPRGCRLAAIGARCERCGSRALRDPSEEQNRRHTGPLHLNSIQGSRRLRQVDDAIRPVPAATFTEPEVGHRARLVTVVGTPNGAAEQDEAAVISPARSTWPACHGSVARSNATSTRPASPQDINRAASSRPSQNASCHRAM